MSTNNKGSNHTKHQASNTNNNIDSESTSSRSINQEANKNGFAYQDANQSSDSLSDSKSKSNCKDTSKSNIHDDHILVTVSFQIALVLSLVGSFYLIPFFNNYWKERSHLIPEGYRIPHVYDLHYTIYPLIILFITKETMAKLTTPLANKIISKKYTGDIYTANRNKIVNHFFKLLYYSSVSIIGHCICVNLKFFPWELFGNNDFMDIFKDGMPGQLFFYKPEYFDIYYLTTLAFVILDLYYLIFVNERQSDYVLMLLHHVCTISLVSYSFLTNGSHVGVIVFYLHDLTDVFVSITRITILTDMNDTIKSITAGTLLISFVYFRLVVFGKYIYQTLMYLNDWHIFNIILWPFLCLLYFMHIYWVYSIAKRLSSKKLEDVGIKKEKENGKKN